jgi:hypothetical protein
MFLCPIVLTFLAEADSRKAFEPIIVADTKYLLLRRK